MSKLIIAIAAALSFLAVTTLPAKAKCPPGSVYGCNADPLNSKMSCGCR